MICRSSYSRAIISRERCPIKSLLFLEKLLAPTQLRRYARSWPECCDGPASSDPWLLVSRPIGCMRAPLDFSHFPQLSVEPLLLCVCIVVTRRHKGKRASLTKKKACSLQNFIKELCGCMCVSVCVCIKRKHQKKKTCCHVYKDRTPPGSLLSSFRSLYCKSSFEEREIL